MYNKKTLNYGLYRNFTIFYVLLLFFIKIYLITFNYIDTERGDGSAYFWDALFGLERFFKSIDLWLSIHPPLSFIHSSLVFKVYSSMNLTDILSYVEFALIFNSLLFLITTYFIFLSLSKYFDLLSALLGVLFFSTAGVIQIFILNGSAEAYSILYLSLFIYFYVQFIKSHKNVYNIVLSAFFLLLASLCRSEVLVFAPIIFFDLIYKRHFFYGILFGAVVSCFEFFKIIMKYLVLDGSFIGYENISKFWVIQKKTFYYIFFEGNTTEYFLNSFNIYFSIFILIASIILFLKKEYRLFTLLFIFMSIILILFQYIGKINSNDRYAFFPAFIFVFLITGVFYHIHKKGIINYFYLFLFSFFLSFSNFYFSIDEKMKRLDKSLIDTKLWLVKNVNRDDYVFFDFMNYWSMYYRLHLASKFPLNPSEYKTHHYHYNVGNTYTVQNKLYGIEFNKDIYSNLDKDYLEPIVTSQYLKSNSFEFELKKKIVSEFFITQFKPKIFVLPKKSFQKYMKFTFIKDKIIPLDNNEFLVKLEYLNFIFKIKVIHENDNFMIFNAEYENFFELEEINSIKSYVYRIKKGDKFFINLNSIEDNCIKNIILSSGYSENGNRHNAKYVYYYINKGNNILSIYNENLSKKTKKFENKKIDTVAIYLYPKKDKNINECVQSLSFFKIKAAK